MKKIAPTISIWFALLPKPAMASDDSVSVGVGLFLIFIFIIIYFIPAIIANNRKHLSSGAILVFNIFLGWTFLGWVLALVWSLTGNTQANAERYSKPPGV